MDADATTKAVRVRVSGRVQGVWFRGWTVERAVALGLSGWVRNRVDGTVEALFSGEAAAVDAMVEECRRGPPAARVSGLTVTLESPRYEPLCSPVRRDCGGAPGGADDQPEGSDHRFNRISPDLIAGAGFRQLPTE